MPSLWSHLWEIRQLPMPSTQDLLSYIAGTFFLMAVLTYSLHIRQFWQMNPIFSKDFMAESIDCLFNRNLSISCRYFQILLPFEIYSILKFMYFRRLLKFDDISKFYWDYLTSKFDFVIYMNLHVPISLLKLFKISYWFLNQSFCFYFICMTNEKIFFFSLLRP